MTDQLRFPTDPTPRADRPTMVTHLDEHTRRIGQAGVASARAILAACAPTVLDQGAGLSTRNGPAQHAPREAEADRTDEVPVDGVDPGLPAAA